MQAIFVVGTDTGVGKTIITGLLGRYLLDQKINVATQKWVQTGCSVKFSSDIQLHLQLMQRKKSFIKNYQDLICPYIFKTASSPHLASRIEHKEIRAEKIKRSFKLLSRRFDCVLVEGSGGALVPYNNKSLVIDIAQDLNLPVLLVAGNKLGAINHTLLTIEALKARRMKILGIIFNPSQKSPVFSPRAEYKLSSAQEGALDFSLEGSTNLSKTDSLIMRDNPSIIERLTKEKVFGTLPWASSYDKLYEKFVPIAKTICKEISK